MALPQRERTHGGRKPNDLQTLGPNSETHIDRFPYEYGSDLHWLWGWGYRLDDLLTRDRDEPSKHDWMVFRPDGLAVDAMMRFSRKYAYVIKQVDEYLEFVEEKFGEFFADDNGDTRANFEGAMLDLVERIRVATETIADAETPKAEADSPSVDAVEAEEPTPEWFHIARWQVLEKAYGDADLPCSRATMMRLKESGEIEIHPDDEGKRAGFRVNAAKLNPLAKAALPQ